MLTCKQGNIIWPDQRCLFQKVPVIQNNQKRSIATLSRLASLRLVPRRKFMHVYCRCRVTSRNGRFRKSELHRASIRGRFKYADTASDQGKRSLLRRGQKTDKRGVSSFRTPRQLHYFACQPSADKSLKRDGGGRYCAFRGHEDRDIRAHTLSLKIKISHWLVKAYRGRGNNSSTRTKRSGTIIRRHFYDNPQHGPEPIPDNYRVMVLFQVFARPSSLAKWPRSWETKLGDDFVHSAYPLDAISFSIERLYHVLLFNLRADRSFS